MRASVELVFFKKPRLVAQTMNAAKKRHPAMFMSVLLVSCGVLWNLARRANAAPTRLVCTDLRCGKDQLKTSRIPMERPSVHKPSAATQRPDAPTLMVARASSKLPLIPAERPSVHKSRECEPEAFCTDFQCSKGFIKTSTGACGKTEWTQNQCCELKTLCTEFDCGKGFIKTSTDACGKTRSSQNQSAHERLFVPTFNMTCFIKTSSKTCGKTKCARDQCCTPEATCTSFKCGAGFIKLPLCLEERRNVRKASAASQRPIVRTSNVAKASSKLPLMLLTQNTNPDQDGCTG